jgi:hypothetical protein
LALLGFSLAVVGCAWFQGRVTIGEELLSAAGFHRYYPQDDEEQTHLRGYPQQQLLIDRHAVTPTYLYADRSRCDCLFLGDQGAYDRLKVLGREQVNADEAFQAAELKEARTLGRGGMGWGGY